MLRDITLEVSSKESLQFKFNLKFDFLEKHQIANVLYADMILHIIGLLSHLVTLIVHIKTSTVSDSTTFFCCLVLFIICFFSCVFIIL